MILTQEDLIKLLVAIVAGGLIGSEREFRDKAAGFRTIILICVGACLFMMFSLKVGGADDPVRIAANIVSGVGFLGAGVIMRDERRVTGLTTASTIWLAAALGMGIGGGFYGIIGAAVGLVLIVLWIFPIVEGWIDGARELRTYEVICPISQQKFQQLEALFAECKLGLRAHKQTKRGDDMICRWDAYGSPHNHDQFVARLFADAEIKEFRF